MGSTTYIYQTNDLPEKEDNLNKSLKNFSEDLSYVKMVDRSGANTPNSKRRHIETHILVGATIIKGRKNIFGDERSLCEI